VHRAELAALGRRGWAVASLAGVFLALHFGTWVPSVRMTSVASATALVATQAVFTGLIAAGAGRRLPRLAWVGMVLAIIGTALIAGADFAVSTQALAGDGLAVLGAIFAAAYVTAGASARQQMSAATYTTICYSVGALGLLVACLVGGQPLGGYSNRAWLLILAVTGCAQLLGHSLFNVVRRSGCTSDRRPARSRGWCCCWRDWSWWCGPRTVLPSRCRTWTRSRWDRLDQQVRQMCLMYWVCSPQSTTPHTSPACSPTRWV
jgi:EamA-like transporter family